MSNNGIFILIIYFLNYIKIFPAPHTYNMFPSQPNLVSGP